MPARNGDCTSVRNRVSTSCGSTVRAAAGAEARRALKVRSSISHRVLSADPVRSDRPSGRRAGGAAGGPEFPIMRGLVTLDQLLHPDRVGLAMAVAGDGIGPAAGLDED